MLINPAALGIFRRAGLDGIRGEQSAAIEPVLLIHGTFANKRNDDGRVDWWRPGSDCCRELDTLLAKEGSAARCWAQLRNGDAPGGAETHAQPPFAWSGANSERDRRDAGRALAAELTALEHDSRVRRYHLIGHSHGGNVILHALRAMTDRPQRLGAVIFMGTPVMSFKHREAFDMRWLAVPLYAAALAGSVWAYRHWPDDTIVWGTVIAAIALALIAEIFLPRSRARRAEAELYGSGYARAFAFDGDEAISSLRAAQGIARKPGCFIDQFTEPAPAPQPAVAPTPPPLPSFASRMQNTGAYWLLQILQAPASVAYLPDTLPDAAPVANPRSRLSTGLQTLVQTIEQASLAFPFKAIMMAVLWLCVLLPLLIMVAAGAIYSATTWLIGSIVAAVMIGGAKKLGRLALPVLVRKAALGADSGRFVEVLELPPGAARERVSEQLQAKATAVSSQFGRDTGQVILHAIANSDPFAIKSRVTDALTNTALAHSYYYQAPEVREKIARLIATRPAATDTPPMGLAVPGLHRLPLADWLKDTPIAPPSPAGQSTPPR